MTQILPLVTIHLGIQRLAVEAGWADSPGYLPKDFVQEMLYLDLLSAGKLGDRPLIVLTAGKPDDDPDPLLTEKDQEEQRNVWIHVLQVEEAHLSARGKHIIQPDTGHMTPFGRPDAEPLFLAPVKSGPPRGQLTKYAMEPRALVFERGKDIWATDGHR